MKVKSDHRSKFSNLSTWKEEAWKKKKHKNEAFNRSRTCALRDTGGMLYQLSYEATHWDVIFIRDESEGLIFFQASSLQLLKLENLLRWSFFNFIYNRSSHLSYFMHTIHIISLLTGWHELN